jgi:hypothetical protein
MIERIFSWAPGIPRKTGDCEDGGVMIPLLRRGAKTGINFALKCGTAVVPVSTIDRRGETFE